MIQALVQATNAQCPITKKCETLADRYRYGVKTYANGNVYNGSLVDEKRNGEGVLTWPNGSVYNGSWVDDTRAGEAQCGKTSKKSSIFEQFHFAAKLEKSPKKT